MRAQRPRQVEQELRALAAIVRPVDGRLEAGRSLRESGERLRAPELGKHRRAHGLRWRLAQGANKVARCGRGRALLERPARRRAQHVDHGDEIPFASRIVAVCDAFNAMTTTRSYRKAMPVGVAIEELHRCSGTQFDPGVVAALVAVVGDPAWELTLNTEPAAAPARPVYSSAP